MKTSMLQTSLVFVCVALTTGCAAESTTPAALIKKLEEGTPRERYEAAVLLGRIEKKQSEASTKTFIQVEKALVKALQADTSPEVRGAAAGALANRDVRYPNPVQSRAYAVLLSISLTSDNSFDVKLAAALCLGMLSDQTLPPLLLCTAATDKDKETRKAALLGLGRCDCDAARLFLQLQVSIDPDPVIKGLAASSLAQHQQKAIKHLIDILANLNATVGDRRMAEISTINALKEVTGQDFGTEHKQWRAWWSRIRAPGSEDGNPPENEKRSSVTQPAKSLNIDCDGGAKMEFILIPAGEFVMGQGFKAGQHKVTISKPFYMSKHEVTQAQWEAVMNDNPSKWKGPDLPVEQVSWNACRDFCKKLSQSLGRTFRLPTEAEWEYACHAGTTTDFSFGGSDPKENVKLADEYAWYFNNSDGKTHPVGSKKPNPWGLHEMHGNVSEWCQDWYAAYSPEPQVDPTGPTSGKDRALRGGSIDWELSSSVCTTRGYTWPSNRQSSFGCRLVLDLK
ncbi:MAG: SUMF1/EgtB/PvdO family nonheme iron enzyme [Phycisphaerae bacterium]|nr:SUMF1/EgtB/PvdO family nonheme iron enzyme [Phycisphaerae bacterium]